MASVLRIIVGSAAAAIVLGATLAAALHVLSRRTSLYTDGNQIAVRIAEAPLRTILWQPPRQVPGAINTAADEYEPRLSADGTRMIFVRGKPGANADLFESRWTATGWSTPSPVTGINSPADDLGPELSSDGSRLYFYSDRPGGSGGFDLWMARADGDGWKEPENLGTAINSDQNEYGPALSVDGSRLYFSSNRLRPGEPVRQRDAWNATLRESRDRHDYDLYEVSIGSEQLPSPLMLLNTSFDEGAPCVSPAGDFLYFASDRPGGDGGFDLYRARLDRGVLQGPESLGHAINSASNELDPGLSMDGFRLCFSSSRPAAGDLPDGASAPAGDYGLWMSSSREVYLRADSAAAWGALFSLLRECLPWLLLLIPLVVLAWLMRQASFRSRFWKLSLLAQCVLISLLIHAGVASGLAVWKVGSRVGEFLSQGGGHRVILASGGVPDGAMLEVTGGLSDPLELPVEVGSSRADMDVARVVAAGVNLEAPPIAVAPQHLPLEQQVPETHVPEEVGRATAAIGGSVTGEQRVPGEEAPPPAVQEAMVPMVPAAAGGDSRPRVAAATMKAPSVQVSTGPSTHSGRDDAALLDVPIDTGEPLDAPAGGAAPSTAPIAALADAARARVPRDEAPRAGVEEAASSLPDSAIAGAGERASLGGLGRGVLPRLSRVHVPVISPMGEDVAQGAQGGATPLNVSMEGESGDAPGSPAAVPTALRSPLVAGDAVGARLPAVEPEPKPLDTLAQRAPEVRDELLERMGGSEQTERAVGRALEWLAQHQAADGRWSGAKFDEGHEASGGAAEVESDAAMTGLALLCFLGAGHTHVEDGPYREHVKRGINWLVARQRADGDLRRDAANPAVPGETMYSHNIATVAMCEAFAMTRDRALTQPTRRAVAFMVSIQANPDPTRRGSRARVEDTSVIGWQVMAMESARRSGFSVPQRAFDAAGAWLDRVESRETPGRYSYAPGQPPSAAMTAEAMFIRQLLGHDGTQPRMKESAACLLESPPRWTDGAPTHSWYYATLAMFQHQGEAWRAWNDLLVPELLRSQHQSGPAAGTWDPQDEWSRLGGRIYQTAICTLSLEVYYRYKVPAARPSR